MNTDLLLPPHGYLTTKTLSADYMETLIRRYFDACNAADAQGISACFVQDAVHYFPSGMFGGSFRGAEVIAARWVEAVGRLGSVWTVDNIILDEESGRAVIEWTHFKTFQNKVLRGDEWYEFDATTKLIREIRAYYASPQEPQLEQLELDGFDYVQRGYPVVSPIVRERPPAEG